MRSAPTLSFSFDRFVLVPNKQLLLESGKPVSLGTRALDILTALLARAGELVTKEQLVAHAWPDTVVHEGNLKVHIAAIRRVLTGEGDDLPYIVNVAGRGYRFVADVTTHDALVEAAPAGAAARAVRPAALARIFGRAAVIESVAAQLSKSRFVTIVGPGGIGKTTVARAIAALSAAEEDAPVFVDLAPLSEPHLLTTSIASLLGLAVHSENPLPRLIQTLKDKQLLLVLDSCEHVLDQVAGLVEALLMQAPGLRVLKGPARVHPSALGDRVLR